MESEDLEYTKAPTENVAVYNAMLRWAVVVGVLVAITLLLMGAFLTGG